MVAAGEPFLLLLGDHLYASDTQRSCAAQLVRAYEREDRSVLGLKPTPADQVKHYGCVGGAWKEQGRLLDITEFAEKPDAEYARTHLGVAGIDDDTFLTVFGQYVLTPAVFDFIEEHISGNYREKGEFQLTSCLERVRREEGFAGYVVQGRRFDIGNPGAYRDTLAAYAEA